MEELIPQALIQVLMVAVIYSAVQSALVEWLKQSKLFKSSFVLWLFNALTAIPLGTLFSIYFFEFDLYMGLWTGLFSTVGAASIYKGLIKAHKQLKEIQEGSTNVPSQLSVEAPEEVGAPTEEAGSNIDLEPAIEAVAAVPVVEESMIEPAVTMEQPKVVEVIEQDESVTVPVQTISATEENVNNTSTGPSTVVVEKPLPVSTTTVIRTSSAVGPSQALKQITN